MAIKATVAFVFILVAVVFFTLGVFTGIKSERNDW